MEEFIISLLAEGAINAFMDSNKHADNFELTAGVVIDIFA